MINMFFKHPIKAINLVHKKAYLLLLQKLSIGTNKRALVVFSSLPLFILFFWLYIQGFLHFIEHFNLHPVNAIFNIEPCGKPGSWKNLEEQLTFIIGIACFSFVAIALSFYLALAGHSITIFTDEKRINNLIDSVEKIKAYNEFNTISKNIINKKNKKISIL